MKPSHSAVMQLVESAITELTKQASEAANQDGSELTNLSGKNVPAVKNEGEPPEGELGAKDKQYLNANVPNHVDNYQGAPQGASLPRSDVEGGAMKAEDKAPGTDNAQPSEQSGSEIPNVSGSDVGDTSKVAQISKLGNFILQILAKEAGVDVGGISDAGTANVDNAAGGTVENQDNNKDSEGSKADEGSEGSEDEESNMTDDEKKAFIEAFGLDKEANADEMLGTLVKQAELEAEQHAQAVVDYIAGFVKAAADAEGVTGADVGAPSTDVADLIAAAGGESGTGGDGGAGGEDINALLQQLSNYSDEDISNEIGDIEAGNPDESDLDQLLEAILSQMSPEELESTLGIQEPAGEEAAEGGAPAAPENIPEANLPENKAASLGKIADLLSVIGQEKKAEDEISADKLKNVGERMVALANALSEKKAAKNEDKEASELLDLIVSLASQGA